MDKQLFDDAIGTAPPSTVDIDAVIATQRRAAVARRVAGTRAAAAAGVVVVTLGVATMLPGGSGTTVSPGGQPPQATPGAAAPPVNETAAATRDAPVPTSPDGGPPAVPCTEWTPTAPPAPEQPAAAASRLRGVLSATVQPRLPAGAELHPNPVARYDEGRQYGPLEFFHVFRAGEDLGSGSCAAPQDYFLARATVLDPGGAGNLMAFVGRLGGTNQLVTECAESQAGQPPCTRRVGPAGETVIATSELVEGGSTVYRVDVTKPDGTGVTLTAENVADTVKTGGAPQRTTPPLTLEQLTEIALDPALTLYPAG